jgi:NAD(P)H-flavin reductase
MAIVIRTEAIVSNVIQHTENVVELHFHPKKRIGNFEPGQFLHLALDPYDPSGEWPESRVFSIMNSPTRRDEMVILVSGKGEFTKRVIQLKKEDEVWLKLPYGDFSIDNTNKESIVLIAGGTGVSPFLSYLDYCLDKPFDEIPPIHLYYGVRNKAYILFKEKLETYRQINQFNYTVYLQEGSENGYESGILDIEQIYNQNKKSTFYLSGPFAMINTFKMFLSEHGVAEDKIRIDEW